MSADGVDWLLLNASPDIRTQLLAAPALHPRAARDWPVQGILLTNGDLDHTLGLLSLRESYPLTVFATASVQDGFRQGNVLYRTLERFQGQVRWRTLKLDEPIEAGGLTVKPWAVSGKLPTHLMGVRAPSPEDNIGLKVSDGRSNLVYLPALGAIGARELGEAASASCLFVDGTFWSSGELKAIDPKAPDAAAMAHQPIGDAGGALRAFQAPVRRLFIHVNNTNPILNEDSFEARAVREAGWAVATDGLELTL